MVTEALKLESGSLKGKVGEGLDSETSSEAMSALVDGLSCFWRKLT